jgi:hypothetical protein
MSFQKIVKIKKIESICYFDFLGLALLLSEQANTNMQTQTQPTQTQPTQTPADILQQFSDMLKTHSIVVGDRETLVRLFENIIELCTQIPKAKLKAAVKAATAPAAAKKAPAAAKKAPAAVKKAPATKKAPAAKKLVVEVVGPADAGVCPLESDLAQPVARGRGRPRKFASADAGVDTVGVVETPVGEAEKKKRGRPKKDKSVTISSNDDEDALIAKMIADAKTLNHGDETESEHSDVSVSPVPNHAVCELPMQVEADVPVANELNAKAVKAKAVKAKAVKANTVKEPKEVKAKTVKEPKEVKAKTVKEPKEVKEANEPNVKEVISTIDIVASATSAAPLRENKAHSDGKFYLMANYPRSSFSYSGKTYLRTENDNVYDTMTLELIGVWDHLNHEIIISFDDDEVDELWMSDEE